MKVARKRYWKDKCKEKEQGVAQEEDGAKTSRKGLRPLSHELDALPRIERRTGRLS